MNGWMDVALYELGLVVAAVAIGAGLLAWSRWRDRRRGGR